MFHTYNDAGLYFCNVTAFNLVSNETDFELIFAQIPIVNFTIHDIPPITYGQDNISIPMSVDQGSNMTVYVTFDDIPVETAYIDNVTLNGYAVIRDTYYTENGYFNVTGNVSNLVTPNVSFTLGVWIDYPITNPVITIDKYISATFENVTVTLTMDKCSRFNLTVLFGDGSLAIFSYNDLLVMNESISFYHTYTISGNFEIQITVQNPVDFYATNETAVVQYPVLGFFLNSTVYNSLTFNTNVTFELMFNSSFEMATNASYQIEYGDGSFSKITVLPTTPLVQNITTDTDLILMFSNTFIAGITYTVSVRIWNLVSESVFNVTFEVIDNLPVINFTSYSFDNDTGTLTNGGGPNRDYFALENRVVFNVTLNNWTGLHFHWDFGDGNSYNVNETLIVNYKYTAVGSYTVNLTVSNGVSSVSNSGIIFIHKGCFDIAISANSPQPENSMFKFSVYPGSIATDACYLFDIGVDDAIPSRYQFLGDYTYCSTISEWAIAFSSISSSFINLTSADWENRMYTMITLSPTASPALNLTTLSPSQWMVESGFSPTPENATWNETISSVMPNPGLFQASLQCINRVSNVTVTWETGVTRGPCWWPQVNLTIVNECYSPFCDTVYPDMRTSYRSERLVVYSYVRINCTSTKDAYYFWRVFQQLNDSTDGSSHETEITDLGNAEVYSVGARNLILEPRTLEVSNALGSFLFYLY